MSFSICRLAVTSVHFEFKMSASVPFSTQLSASNLFYLDFVYLTNYLSPRGSIIGSPFPIGRQPHLDYLVYLTGTSPFVVPIIGATTCDL